MTNTDNILPESISLQSVQEELARRKLIDFTTFTFTKYKTQWFHEALADKLDKFASGEITHLMVFMPPQHGKSELVSRRLPAQLFGKNPNLNVILGSYSDTFAKKFCRSIQRTIASEAFQQLFPTVMLDGVNSKSGTYVRTANEFEVHDGKEKTGSFMSVGVGSGATGNPCDVLILDDVIKDRKEAESKTYRDNVYEWWTDALSTRLHDASKVLMTFTRWHEDDLAGRILEKEGRVEDGGKWHVFILPAIKEDNSNPADIRELGEALWPAKHGLVKLHAIENNEPRTWSSLYQQRPAPISGNLVKKEWFEIWTPSQVLTFIRGREVTKHFVVDTAFTTKSKNDPCACLTFFVLDNLLIIVDFWKDRLQAPDLVERLKKQYSRHATRKSHLFIEPKANGISIVQWLQRMRDNNNKLINVHEDFAPDVDKEARVSAITDILSACRVKLLAGLWNNVFVTDLALFPNGKDKEAADVLVMAVDKLENPFNTNTTMRVSLPGKD